MNNFNISTFSVRLKHTRNTALRLTKLTIRFTLKPFLKF